MPDSAVFDTRYFNQAYYSDSPRDRALLRNVFTGMRRRLVSSVTIHVIAATAIREKCPVISDDPHFEEIEGLKVRWIR
ncbi:MAG: hypothetical protein NTV61_08195 [Candidatus Bathyarchaeota archaeon]|nr:hypothetical protein [Candidatus Bathyarchaeota archaeon]